MAGFLGVLQDLQEHIAYLQDEIDAILHEQDRKTMHCNEIPFRLHVKMGLVF